MAQKVLERHVVIATVSSAPNDVANLVDDENGGNALDVERLNGGDQLWFYPVQHKPLLSINLQLLTPLWRQKLTNFTGVFRVVHKSHVRSLGVSGLLQKLQQIEDVLFSHVTRRVLIL